MDVENTPFTDPFLHEPWVFHICVNVYPRSFSTIIVPFPPQAARLGRAVVQMLLECGFFHGPKNGVWEHHGRRNGTKHVLEHTMENSPKNG